MKIELVKSTNGAFACNSWLVEVDNENVIAVDIGVAAEDFLARLGEKKLKAILLTHGHFDHIVGVEGVRKSTGAEVYIAKGDEEMLINPKNGLATWGGKKIPPVTAYRNTEKTLNIAGIDIEVISTPGHTNGSVTYKIESVLFTGDTLFRGSIGRTDLPGGNSQILENSLETLKNLDGDYKICPGHNYITTLQYERENNPYL